MKRLLIAVTASSCCLGSLCAIPPVKNPYTLNASYATVNLTDRKIVVIMPGDRGIVINNRKDVVEDFGGMNALPESRIRKYYFPEFFNEFRTLASGDSIVLLNEYRPNFTWDSLDAGEVALKTDLNSMPKNYALPRKSRLEAIGLGNSVAIILERIEFRRNNFSMEYYWDEKTRKSANLQADATVLVWDFKNDAPVFYGTLSARTEFRFGLQRKQWDESAADLAKKIIMAAKCL